MKRFAIESSDGFYVKTYGPLGYELDYGPRWFEIDEEKIHKVCEELNKRGHRQFVVISS